MTREAFIEKYAGGHYGDKNSDEKRLSDIVGLVFDAANPPEVAFAATGALTADQSGSTVAVATDALVATLPTAVPAGTNFTFRNDGADGAVALTISPNALDKIVGTVANAAADSVSGGALDKDIVNTKATANKGDYIKLIYDGTDTWYIVGGVGIWASEA